MGLNAFMFFYLGWYFVTGNPVFFQGDFAPPAISSLITSAATLTLASVTLYTAFFFIKDSTAFLITTLWIVMSVIDLIRFRTMMALGDYIYNPLVFSLFVSGIFMEFLLIFVEGFPIYTWATVVKGPNTSPELHSHYFSRVFFFWVWSLLWKGSKMYF